MIRSEVDDSLLSTSKSHFFRTPLRPLDMSYFENETLTSFDVAARKIEYIPSKPRLLNRITKVRLTNCNISVMPENLPQYTEIESIELIDNFITIIPDEFFIGFTKLRLLDLSSNKMQDFHCVLPDSLQILDISYNGISDVSSIWKQTLPSLRIIKLMHCEITELPSESPIWISQIRSIFLDGNRLVNFPAYFENFVELDDFSIFGNGVANLSQIPCMAIRSLNVSMNSIESLSEGLPPLKVQSLNLNSNPFKSFPTELFQIDQLRVLTLAKCQIDGVLDFQLPESLIALDLTNNEISGVSDQFIQSCGTIVMLNLSSNNISELPDCFPPACRINKLLLNNNGLTTFPLSLGKLQYLETLNISSNDIESLPNFEFPKLRELDLSFNRITEIPDSFASCMALTTVNFSFNRLKTLPHSLVQCRKIAQIIAAGNEFIAFPHVVFSFAQIQKLVLSGNRITHVPSDAASFFFLKQLDLSNNNFTVFPDILNMITNLTIISFSHNRITSIPENFQFPPKLQLLDLSFNHLEKFNACIPSLITLSLEYNQLKSFDGENLESLKFLTLNCNDLSGEIDDLLEKIRNSAPNCHDVDLIGNPNLIIPDEYDDPSFKLYTDQHVSIPKGFGIGYSATMGNRPTMEDAVTLYSFDDHNSLFAVFDGHIGDTSATTASDIIIDEIQGLLQIVDDTELSTKFSEVFANINHDLKDMGATDGCTAAVVLCRGNKLFVAGIGDSRIVRIRKFEADRLTTDYKPANPDEYRRLNHKGLKVNKEGRINRKLGVARALGDFWCGSGIFVTPDIKSIEIDENDEGIVIACDGVWDVILDAQAARFVRQAETAADAAVTLKNYAYALQSNDNISVIVVKFNVDENDYGLSARNTVEEIPVVMEEEPPKDPPVSARRRRR